VRDPKPYGGMITYHDLEKTSTDKMWTDLMTHLPRLDISRKRAAKTPNPRFRSADNYELKKRATKWLVNDTLRKGGKIIAQLNWPIRLRCETAQNTNDANKTRHALNNNDGGYLTVFHKDSHQYLLKF